MEPAESVDNPVAVPASADPQRCSRCSGSLRFELRLEPPSEQSYGHRIYRCEACGRHEWVAEPPGKGT
jgi:uncharacterized protein with PIN domain